MKNSLMANYNIANKFYITGVRRGLGKALKDKMNCVNSLEECDVFINCKHDGFTQVELLYAAAALDLKIITRSIILLKK